VLISSGIIRQRNLVASRNETARNLQTFVEINHILK
jgi:hypothetical protein